MATQVLLPKIGFSMNEGTVQKYFVVLDPLAVRFIVVLHQPLLEFFFRQVRFVDQRLHGCDCFRIALREGLNFRACAFRVVAQAIAGLHRVNQIVGRPSVRPDLV